MNTIPVNLDLGRHLTKHGRTSINSHLENLSLKILKPEFTLYFDHYFKLKIFKGDGTPIAIINPSTGSPSTGFYNQTVINADIPFKFLSDEFIIENEKVNKLLKVFENAPEVEEIPLEKNIMPNDDHIIKALYYKIDEFKQVYKQTLMEHIQNPENLEKYIKKGFHHLIPTDQEPLLFLEKLQMEAQFPAIIMNKAGVDFIIVEMADGNLFTF